MFERRLKIFLILLSLAITGLLLRAGQFQMVQRAYWDHEAADALKKTKYLETTRGVIVDRKERELAVDRPCVDACVDYRAIVKPADPKWVKEVALSRLQSRLGDAWKQTPKDRREALKKKEAQDVQRDIDRMWDTLAEASGRPAEEVEQIRQSVLQRVEVRKKYVWFHNYEQSLRATGGGSGSNEPKWEKWLSGESDDAPPIDKFNVTVSEETSAHVILHAIGLDVQNELSRHIGRYPGLVLRPGTHRYYPYDDVACHVLGRLGKVDAKEILADPNRKDPRRHYLPNDDIGRDGLESLCEPALRGTLGRMITVSGQEPTIDPPVPGQTVHTSIDIDLQQEIQNFFASATLHDSHGQLVERKAVLHGAAVLLDVKTNQVLALVSYPVYDLNRYDELYAALSDDAINDPLRNRATESQFEPGSTVKPLVGLSAITAGVLKVNEGIECTGKLTLPDHEHHDRPRTLPWGRCWVASMYEKLLNGAVAHHPVPVPHRGHDGNPDGFLTYSDGLERSCNVFFETAADRMGRELLSDWMERFGLGRRTGIGIAEYTGRSLRKAPHRSEQWAERATTFYGGIGQGYVAATPVQMANVAATIARNGIWMRPNLVMPDPETHQLPPFHPGALGGEDRVDLHLDPDAVKACKLGMYNVVNGPAGTGKAAHMDEITVAGKTGTAQAAPFYLPVKENGHVVIGKDGKPLLQPLEKSTPDHPNALAPWYRGTGEGHDKLDHSWMIGFAPAEDPQIAFAVLVEYGGSGGGPAADVVKASLEACIAHGYLQPRSPTTRPAQ